MTGTQSDGETAHSTQRPHIIRAAASVLWAALLAVALSSDAAPDPAPTLVIALLVAYPLIDVVASVFEIRGRHESAKRTALLVNTVISLLTAVALGIAAGQGTSATLRVFGIWALLTGLIQLGSAVARRRRGNRCQWPLILSGGISALAGIAFIEMGSQPSPMLTVLAGYAAAGAVFLLVSVYRSRSRRETEVRAF